MNAVLRLIAIGILGAVMSVAPVRNVYAAGGHENNCTIANVSFGVGSFFVVCTSGTVNAGFLPGSAYMPSDCSTTTNMDSIKIWLAIALAARQSQQVVTVWYSDTCASGTERIISSIELNGT